MILAFAELQVLSWLRQILKYIPFLPLTEANEKSHCGKNKFEGDFKHEKEERLDKNRCNHVLLLVIETHPPKGIFLALQTFL